MASEREWLQRTEETFLREEDSREERDSAHSIMKEGVLSNRTDFENLRKHGRSFGSAKVVLIVNKNNEAQNRKAFLASKKVGNSVERHRATRLMRESLRLIEKEKVIPKGYDFLFIARTSITDSKCADVKKSIEAALSRAKLI